MKFKVGDEVRFNSGFDVGLGTVVAVGKQGMPYLVHSDDITWGHSGGSHENDIYLQDNRNNWWFRGMQLSLVGEEQMKTKEEIRDWLLVNAVDEYGDLMLNSLDFSNFDGNVYIWGMKVKGDLHQQGQEVQGDLYQSGQEVKGDLYQSWQEIQGDYFCEGVEVKGDIFVSEPTKLLKEVTAEELAELGYKLKGE